MILEGDGLLHCAHHLPGFSLYGHQQRQDQRNAAAGAKPDVPTNNMTIMEQNKLLVSFDFDSTLSRKDVQEYATELLQRGVDVWVVTSRFDELHKHRYPHNPTNNDLWEVIDSIGIPRWKVRFTCMESKSLYLIYTKVIWHLDDDNVELQQMRYNKCKTVGISVNSSSWKQKCERYLNKASNINK